MSSPGFRSLTLVEVPEEAAVDGLHGLLAVVLGRLGAESGAR